LVAGLVGVWWWSNRSGKGSNVPARPAPPSEDPEPPDADPRDPPDPPEPSDDGDDERDGDDEAQGHRPSRRSVSATVAGLLSILLGAAWWATRDISSPGAVAVWVLVPVVFGVGLMFVGLSVRLDQPASRGHRRVVAGRLAGDAGVALTTSAAVGFVLFLATSTLEQNLLEQGAQRDDLRFGEALEGLAVLGQ